MTQPPISDNRAKMVLKYNPNLSLWRIGVLSVNAQKVIAIVLFHYQDVPEGTTLVLSLDNLKKETGCEKQSDRKFDSYLFSITDELLDNLKLPIFRESQTTDLESWHNARLFSSFDVDWDKRTLTVRTDPKLHNIFHDLAGTFAELYIESIHKVHSRFLLPMLIIFAEARLSESNKEKQNAPIIIAMPIEKLRTRLFVSKTSRAPRKSQNLGKDQRTNRLRSNIDKACAELENLKICKKITQTVQHGPKNKLEGIIFEVYGLQPLSGDKLLEIRRKREQEKRQQLQDIYNLRPCYIKKWETETNTDNEGNITTTKKLHKEPVLCPGCHEPMEIMDYVSKAGHASEVMVCPNSSYWHFGKNNCNFGAGNQTEAMLKSKNLVPNANQIWRDDIDKEGTIEIEAGTTNQPITKNEKQPDSGNKEPNPKTNEPVDLLAEIAKAEKAFKGGE